MVRVGNICNIFLPLQTAPVLSVIRAVGVLLVLQLLYSTSLCSSSLLEHKAGSRAYSVELNSWTLFQKTQKIKLVANIPSVVILVDPVLPQETGQK